ncbi:MAG: hypothetical protein LBT30_03890 [Clostridiales bacterium]|jgi:hypothetical protein|nr:hypothetical protein [Clostridiales bacterium]
MSEQIKTTDTGAYQFSAKNIGTTADLSAGSYYNTKRPEPAAPAPVLTKKEQKAKDKADKKAAKKNK